MSNNLSYKSFVDINDFDLSRNFKVGEIRIIEEMYPQIPKIPLKY